MIDRKTIGRRIAKYREKNGLTQAQLAEQLGFTAKHISNIERGKVHLTTDLLSNVADKLGLEVISLLMDADPAQPAYGMSEIQEITKEWTADEKELLIKIADEMNSHFNH